MISLEHLFNETVFKLYTLFHVTGQNSRQNKEWDAKNNRIIGELANLTTKIITLL
jgi:hypothetical protein